MDLPLNHISNENNNEVLPANNYIHNNQSNIYNNINDEKFCDNILSECNKNNNYDIIETKINLIKQNNIKENNEMNLKFEFNNDDTKDNNYELKLTDDEKNQMIIKNTNIVCKTENNIMYLNNYDDINSTNIKNEISNNDQQIINNNLSNNNNFIQKNLCENMTDEEKRHDALVKSEEFDKRLSESSQQNRMRLAIGLLLRIVLPLANGVASRLKNFRTDRLWRMLRSLGTNKQTITSMLAYAANTISLGLSSVQVSHRIDPIIKIIKLKKAQIFERHHGKNLAITSTITSANTTTTTTTKISWETQQIIYSPARHLSLPKIETPELIETAEQCVNIKILCEPPAGEPIRADIIFIHGLHGSLPNTWKQGLWSNERMPVDFERPPKPPLRPPKRPRYSRSNIFVPPHSNKKPRWAEHISESDLSYMKDKDDFDFILDGDDKENIIYFNPSSTTQSTPSTPNEYEKDLPNEYNLNVFSTFRLRLDDYDNPAPRPRTAKTRPKNAEPTAEDIFPFEQPYSRCWPGDWLPLDCPGVRVIAVNYTTDPHLWRPVWVKKHHRSSMSERVRVMTERLINLKVGHGHPIVWVGHSKGGLYIKQILVDAWESGKLSTAPLWQSSRGVFFYSVPHRGSTLADINLPLVRRSIELVEIEKNSKVLSDLHRRFVNLYYSGHLNVEVFSFVETAMTFMQFLYLRIVGVDSADPGIGDVCGLQLDHREICKPRSRNCILYTELVKMINKVC